MSKHVFKELKFYFRNGDTWTVDHGEMSDVWISRVTTSFGRIEGGRMQEIHPCKRFRIEILPEADYIKDTDVSTAAMADGMFNRIIKYQDIEKLDIEFGPDENKEPMEIYLPFKQKDAEGLDNVYQSSAISKQNGNLYVAVDEDHSVYDLYKDRL
ncbi:hypothetical protein [Companilactobacillus mishanensis]|uniref:Uncharacterized protein n=1 Tax=Companilactobacillus mishanensis TaxID=2486008 RepID=A0A5P0ZF73_9LACO|nr:hypothetical protein [Companilactobacillus mishanensis]MQS44180.1 hypothetical protein [Companilactobacillus mishanensis]MQS51711.1 hypothetical protein [Companilactobacillus mishanensis]MQS88478.1 hypothetical protein [Companilactobacillus mishanensis]